LITEYAFYIAYLGQTKGDHIVLTFVFFHFTPINQKNRGLGWNWILDFRKVKTNPNTKFQPPRLLFLLLSVHFSLFPA